MFRKDIRLRLRWLPYMISDVMWCCWPMDAIGFCTKMCINWMVDICLLTMWPCVGWEQRLYWAPPMTSTCWGLAFADRALRWRPIWSPNRWSITIWFRLCIRIRHLLPDWNLLPRDSDAQWMHSDNSYYVPYNIDEGEQQQWDFSRRNQNWIYNLLVFIKWERILCNKNWTINLSSYFAYLYCPPTHIYSTNIAWISISSPVRHQQFEFQQVHSKQKWMQKNRCQNRRFYSMRSDWISFDAIIAFTRRLPPPPIPPHKIQFQMIQSTNVDCVPHVSWPDVNVMMIKSKK